MKSLNSVQILGLLGSTPKIYAMANGTLVSRFSVATENTYKDKSTNTVKYSTEWHAVVVFGKLAEIAERFLQKGTRVYIDGRLKTREYEDDEKITRRITEIMADDLIILSNGKDQPITSVFNFDELPSNDELEINHEA